MHIVTAGKLTCFMLCVAREQPEQPTAIIRVYLVMELIHSSMDAEGLWDIARPMKDTSDPHPFIVGHEEDQVSAVPRTSQAGRQLAAGWETVRPLRDRRHGRFDLGNERQGTRRIIERDEIGNLDQISPCGR